MMRKHYAFAILLPLGLFAAADQTWKDKQMSQWNTEDARQVMSDSPWAKQVTPLVNSSYNSQRGSRGQGRRGGMGGGGGGLGIPGIGFPGGGGTGRRGGGYPGGGGYPQDGSGYPQDGRGNNPQSGDDRGGNSGQGDRSDPPTLTVRWESALPIQQAVLKAKEDTAPSIDENHYAIAVIGLPSRMARDPQMTESHLKGQAELKRAGKKLSKPSDVRVISRDEGLMVVYFFPRSKEIHSGDHDIEFDAHLGRFEIKPLFDATEMVYQGKLEL